MTYAELCDLLIEHSEREATNQTAFWAVTRRLGGGAHLPGLGKLLE